MTPLDRRLVDTYQLTDPGKQRVPVKSSDPAQIVAEAGIDNGFILDVTNEAWFTMSHVRRPKHYNLGYSVRVTLIDAAKKKVIRSGELRWLSVGNPYATRAENNAAVFRGELEAAGAESIKYFISRALSEKG